MSSQDQGKQYPVPYTREQMQTTLWSWQYTFRHGQCDPAGIVYTPEFFNVFNHAIEHWFEESLGLSYYDILGPRQIGLGYVSASAEFFTPVLMGEEVEIFVQIREIGGKSYSLELNAFKGDREALRGKFTTVTTSLETHSSIKIPADIRMALSGYGKS